MLNVLPVELQQKWMASLEREVFELADGHFYLVDIKPTQGNGFEGQRVIVNVVDENGFPVPNVTVAFSYSTAPQYIMTQEMRWIPPTPHRAFLTPTDGSGKAEQIQGSVVREGQPGGITVYILDSQYSSDVISGLGMLADHTGVKLTLQLKRNGVLSIKDRMDLLEARIKALESK